MRFRKSVKICKGVRINFSKSGASCTFGVPGLSVNVGSKGTYLNTGIPGTGIYDRTKLTGGSKPSARNQTYTSYQSNIPNVVNLKLDDNGNITFYDDSDNLIVDPAVIRKIKSSQSFKDERERMMNKRFNDINRESEKFIKIYKLSPKVVGESAFYKELNNLKLKTYTKKTYTAHEPTQSDVLSALEIEAVQCVKSWKFWSLNAKRREYVNSNLEKRFNDVHDKWESEKNNFERQQEKIEKEKNQEYFDEYSAAKRFLENAINGDIEFIETQIQRWLSSVTLPVDFNCQFQYSSGLLLVDLDLPEIEDLPATKATRLANGTVKNKNKTQKELKGDYIDCVFGLAVFFGANLFNISPAIEKILVSGYTQRRNAKTGDIQDDYVYSIVFNRDKFENETIDDPIIFCMECDNRCNITQALLLKKIEPFEVTDIA